WSEAGGLQLHLNKGNGRHGLQLELAGHRRVSPQGGMMERSNAEGFGTWVTAHSVGDWTGLEYTTLSAGLGQSLQPVLLGMGRHTGAEVVPLHWRDSVRQAECDLPVTDGPPPPGNIYHLEEANRKQTSCPVLFTWDGDRFVFVTDFLGAGSVGESQAGG